LNRETAIQRRIMLALSEAGCTVWRNEVGGMWVGRVIHQDGQTVTLANAQMIQAGLCTGSADLVGISPVVVTPEMVGETVGRFMGIEVKTEKGRASVEQKNWTRHVLARGGVAGIARSEQDAVDLVLGEG